MAHKPLSREEQEQIRSLLLAGHSHNAVGKMLGRSQSTISNLARKEAIPTLNRTPREAIESHQVKALEDRLAAASEIAQKALSLARSATSGKELKECATAFAIAVDKQLLMQGLPTSRAESRTTRSSGVNLEEEFARLDAELEAQHAEQVRQREENS